ncbi:protein MCM10 homolog [Sesamum indicum]|uniref:Protein MCM10 homolog n=1 Tax=Sesamum indicum TaxID=4182 RepID=A0A6I9TS96_SESIN|nr:protein MCM10 homolog [Sesamum indicum]
MSNSNHQDDLDLLLSLEDRVLETPPASPSGYLSDDGMPNRSGYVDMSVFREAVQDCLDYNPKERKERHQKSEQGKRSSDIEVDKFSGLRIQNRVVSRVELSNHLSDIRFVRLPTIKNLLKGDTLSGCWATIGVLTEKGIPRTSSIGKTFTIWKMGCLDELTISLFLFGDAYQKSCEEKIGTIFALFNCTVRKDNKGSGFSLSVYSAKHILKLGTSADIGICQGKGKDGVACTAVINKRRRKYCSYHKRNALKTYTSTRTELKGGNLRTGFRDYLKSEGIYVVKPTDDRTNITKSNRPVKVLSVEGLKKALSNADKVTTNVYSQGIRFLNQLTGKTGPKVTIETTSRPHQQMSGTDKRSRPIKVPDAKKLKMDQRQAPGQDTKVAGVKMIELDFASSDDEI